ncbi:MAG: TM0106 family RecB-like putative nuclease [Nitrospirae bacterium]|nr:TM0106 family RecB-like putative nuclease [Nitrospirota bacterium]
MTYHLLKDPFWIWCGYHAPREEAVEEESRYDEMKMQRGSEYEEAWVKEHYPNAVKVQPEFGLAALQDTIRLMLEGTPAIYQPQLWHLRGEMYGKGDLLVRDDSRPSDLGDFHYRVKEIKHSKKLQPYHTLQGACYNWMLGVIQGYKPETVTVVLKETEEAVSYERAREDLESHLSTWSDLRDGKLRPGPTAMDCTDSPWRVYANKLLLEKLDLTLLPGVGPAGREHLRAALGVTGIRELYEFSLDHLRRALGEKSGTDIYRHAQSYKLGRPIPRNNYPFHVPRAKRNIHFDFETSDEVHPSEPPHIYLIGAFDEERERFAYFLGKGAAEEEKIFHDFLEYAGDPRDVCLYHWTDFEIGEIKGVERRYPLLAGRLEALRGSCVDLKEAVRQQFYLAVPTYSIKSVAPFLGFNWRQKDVGAFESMVLYWDYLEGDNEGIKKAIMYNEDDVLAMVHILRVLSGLRPGALR